MTITLLEYLAWQKFQPTFIIVLLGIIYSLASSSIPATMILPLLSSVCQNIGILNRIQGRKMFKQAYVPTGLKMLLIAATALHSAWRQPDRTQLSPASFGKKTFNIRCTHLRLCNYIFSNSQGAGVMDEGHWAMSHNVH